MMARRALLLVALVAAVLAAVAHARVASVQDLRSASEPTETPRVPESLVHAVNSLRRAAAFARDEQNAAHFAAGGHGTFQARPGRPVPLRRQAALERARPAVLAERQSSRRVALRQARTTNQKLHRADATVAEARRRIAVATSALRAMQGRPGLANDAAFRARVAREAGVPFKPSQRRRAAALSDDDIAEGPGVGASGQCMLALQGFFAGLDFDGADSCFGNIDSIFASAVATNLTAATAAVTEYCDASGCAARMNALVDEVFEACAGDLEYLFPDEDDEESSYGADSGEADGDGPVVDGPGGANGTDSVNGTDTANGTDVDAGPDADDNDFDAEENDLGGARFYTDGDYLWLQFLQGTCDDSSAREGANVVAIGPPGACVTLGNDSIRAINCTGGQWHATRYENSTTCAGDAQQLSGDVGCGPLGGDHVAQACSNYSPFEVPNAEFVLYLMQVIRLFTDVPCVQAEGEYCWPGLFNGLHQFGSAVQNATELGSLCGRLPCIRAVSRVCDGFGSIGENPDEDDAAADGDDDEGPGGICHIGDVFDLACSTNSAGELCLPLVLAAAQDCSCECGFGLDCINGLCAHRECLARFGEFQELTDDDEEDTPVDDNSGIQRSCVCDGGNSTDADGGNSTDADGANPDAGPAPKRSTTALVNETDADEDDDDEGFNLAVCDSNAEGEVCYTKVLQLVSLVNLTSCPGGGNPANTLPGDTCDPQCRAAMKEILDGAGCCTRSFFASTGGADAEERAEAFLRNSCGLGLGAACRGSHLAEFAITVNNVDVEAYAEEADELNGEVAAIVARAVAASRKDVSVVGPRCLTDACVRSCEVRLTVRAAFNTAAARDAAVSFFGARLAAGDVPVTGLADELGFEGVCDRTRPITIAGTAGAEEPPASLSAQCLRTLTRVGEGTDACAASLDLVFSNLTHSEGIEEFCEGTGSCRTRLGSAATQLAAACDADDLVTLDELFPSLLEGLKSAGQYARVACVEDDGTYCLPVFGAAVSGGIDIETATQESLGAVCGQCVSKVIRAIDQFIDPDFARQFIFLDVACVRKRSNASEFCLPEFNRVRELLDAGYEFPVDPRDNTTAGPTDFLSPAAVGSMCGNRCFFRVLRQLADAQDELGNDVDGAALLNDLRRFETLSCVQAPNSTDLCYERVVDELATNSFGQQLIYDGVCPDLAGVTSRSGCRPACATALEGFLTRVGCCGPSFLRLNGRAQLEKIWNWYGGSCGKRVADVSVPCPAKRVSGALRFGNVRAATLLADDALLARFKTACKKSLAQLAGVAPEDVIIRRVGAAKAGKQVSSQAAAKVAGSRQVGVAAVSSGGVAVDYVIETENDDQASAVATDVDTAIKSGAATFGDVNRALPSSALLDPSDVDTGITTDSAVETLTDGEIDELDRSPAAAPAATPVLAIVVAVLVAVFLQ